MSRLRESPAKLLCKSSRDVRSRALEIRQLQLILICRGAPGEASPNGGHRSESV